MAGKERDKDKTQRGNAKSGKQEQHLTAVSAELKEQKVDTKPVREGLIIPDPPHELQASFSFTHWFLEGRAGLNTPVSNTNDEVKDHHRLPSHTRMQL